MADNFKTALAFTLLSEGGFSDDEYDPGGATMDGITLAEYQHYHGLQLPAPGDLPAWTQAVANLKAMPDDERDLIYQKNYWEPSHAQELPPGVDLSVWDMAVNAGVYRSICLLQTALGVNKDGIFGPVTLKEAFAVNASVLLRRLYSEQAKFYRSLSTFPHFGHGWLVRTGARLAAAMLLIPDGGGGSAKAE